MSGCTRWARSRTGRARRLVVRILDTWPTGDELLAAYRRIALIT